MNWLARALRLVGPWRTLVADVGIMGLGEALARVFALLALLVMTRRLGPAGFGLVSFGVALSLWCSLLVDSGTEVDTLRVAARDPDRFRSICEPVMGLRLALSGFAAIVLAIAVFLSTPTGSDRVVLLLFVLSLPLTALNLRSIALVVGGARAIATGNALGQLAFAGGVVLLVTDEHDTFVVPLLHAGDELISGMAILAALVPALGFVRPRVDLARWRETMRRSWALLVNSAARAVVYSFDVLLIAIVLGREQVGYYSAAYKPILLMVTALALVKAAFLRHYSSGTEAVREQLFRRTMVVTLALTLPVAIIGSAAALPLVKLAYGHPYGPAAPPLAILIWFVPVLALGMPYANVLIAAHRERVLMRNYVIGAAANAAANLAVVPLVGLSGAAAVTLASELLTFALNSRAVVAAGLAPPPSQLVRTFVQQYLVPGLGRAP